MLCGLAPTRGSGSSSRTSNMPPVVSTLVPTHHLKTKTLARPRMSIETASLSNPRIPESVITRPSEPQQEPSVVARYGPLGTILRRRRRPLSMPPGRQLDLPAARAFG
jgi:hypothetical protein